MSGAKGVVDVYVTQLAEAARKAETASASAAILLPSAPLALPSRCSAGFPARLRASQVCTRGFNPAPTQSFRKVTSLPSTTDGGTEPAALRNRFAVWTAQVRHQHAGAQEHHRLAKAMMRAGLVIAPSFIGTLNNA